MKAPDLVAIRNRAIAFHQLRSDVFELLDYIADLELAFVTVDRPNLASDEVPGTSFSAGLR
jgi:hypothetical protein